MARYRGFSQGQLILQTLDGDAIVCYDSTSSMVVWADKEGVLFYEDAYVVVDIMETHKVETEDTFS